MLNPEICKRCWQESLDSLRHPGYPKSKSSEQSVKDWEADLSNGIVSCIREKELLTRLYDSTNELINKDKATFKADIRFRDKWRDS